jgi:hypothetical protein
MCCCCRAKESYTLFMLCSCVTFSNCSFHLNWQSYCNGDILYKPSCKYSNWNIILLSSGLSIRECNWPKLLPTCLSVAANFCLNKIHINITETINKKKTFFFSSPLLHNIKTKTKDSMILNRSVFVSLSYFIGWFGIFRTQQNTF